MKACSGHIGSLIELLRGGLSDHVMRIVTERERGLFPSPSEISLECSCPDWATTCKHVAASMYGVGVRLDERPEPLFTLRGVDPAELVARAATGRVLDGGAAPRGRALESSSLSALFGVDIDEAPARPRGRRPTQSEATPKPAPRRSKTSARKKGASPKSADPRRARS